MAEPHSSRPPLRGRRLPSSAADFFRCLRTVEDEVRRLPRNLCVLLTHTPLTQDGSRYSLFEGQGHKLGTHWHSEGELPHYPLVGQPETFPFGIDRFPFGVVLSRTSDLLELVVDSAECTSLNFGYKGGYYVAGDAIRDSLPEGKVAYEFTERTIWHYFAENTGEPIPDESLFASVNEQLLHCYRGIRETFSRFESELSFGTDELNGIIYELEWPEILLYLGLKNPGPFFGVERRSVERSCPGEPREPLESMMPWEMMELKREFHHVFKFRPPSVARATSYALEALSRVVRVVDEPVVGAPVTNVAAPAIPAAQTPRAPAAESDGGTSTPSSGKRSTEATTDDQPLSRLLSVFTDGLADDRIQRASTVLQDDKLTANEKLRKIDGLIRFPATASARQLGQLLGVSKTAVQKTEWWKDNRKDKKADEIDRREQVHKQRASQLESAESSDNDE